MVARGSLLGCLAALLLPACKATPPEPAQPDAAVPEDPPPFVFAEELALFVGHPGVRIVDARDERSWLRGTVPGAVHLDWTELRDPAGGRFTGKLDEDYDRLAGIVGERGLGDAHWIVVLGDPLHGWGEEARIAWVLRTLGHARVSLLDGGIGAWKAEGRPLQKGRLTLPPQVFTARPDDSTLARQPAVEEFAGQADDWRTVLVDVRTPEEFEARPGAPSHGAPRAGHIPGAINVPWNSLLDERGMLRPRDELGELLVPLGVRPDARVITYCTGGVRSAHTWYVLDALGFPAVRNFAGSWWEWSLDRRLPVEKGKAKPRELPPFPLTAEPEAPTPEAAPAKGEAGNRYGEHIPEWLRPPGDILPQPGVLPEEQEGDPAED